MPILAAAALGAGIEPALLMLPARTLRQLCLYVAGGNGTQCHCLW